VGEGIIGAKSTKTYEINGVINTRSGINALVYSPDGTQFASGGQAAEKNVAPVVDTGVYLWDELREPSGTLKINTQKAFTLLINGKRVAVPVPTLDQQFVIGDIDITAVDFGIRLKRSSGEIVKIPAKLRLRVDNKPPPL
jgi:hypothetical protein